MSEKEGSSKIQFTALEYAIAEAGAFGFHTDIIEEYNLKGEIEAYKGH